MKVKEFIKNTKEFKDGYVEMIIVDDGGNGIEEYFGIETLDELWKDEKNATIKEWKVGSVGEYILIVNEIVYSRNIDSPRCPVTQEKEYVKLNWEHFKLSDVKEILGEKQTQKLIDETNQYWKQKYGHNLYV